MNESFRPKSEEWIEQLKPFKGSINGILGPDEKPSVKVTLLDDGTKLTDRSLWTTSRKGGKSFRPDNEAYFAGPSPPRYGTVRKWRSVSGHICPMAELYIARLERFRWGEIYYRLTQNHQKAESSHRL